MKKSRLAVMSILILFLMQGCWRGYYHHPRYGSTEGRECRSENQRECQPVRAYGGCGMW